VPAGNGPGAAVDVSALGLFKTATVGGDYRGNVQIEISEDGISAWSQIGLGFPNPGAQSQVVAARFMRAVRSGVPLIAPGLPIVDVGGSNVGSSPAGTTAALGPPGVDGADGDQGPLGPQGPIGPIGPQGPATTGAVLFWGVDSIAAAADSRFLSPGYQFATAPLADNMQMPMPRAGVLRRLHVRHNAAGGNGVAVTYTVLVNGIATAIVVVLATGAIGQASDLVNAVAVVIGDRVSVRATKPASIGGGNINVSATVELA
jgi:hypothetical protein